MQTIKWCIVIYILLFISRPWLRAEWATTDLQPVSGLTCASLYHETTLPATAGVLVLFPGMNGEGKRFAAESPWYAFAKANGLGLVGASFSSPPEALYGQPAKGYYYPDQGSGDALIKGLREIYGREVKIFIYGFSGGAQFTSRFVEQHPEMIISWAAYAGCFWSAPISASSTSAPGIVACGEYDVGRYGPAFGYFQQGRRRDARWIWLSLQNIGHIRDRELEEFIRATFAAVLAGDFKQATWLDAETKHQITEDERLLNPALSVWLPTHKIADLWLKLHHP